MMAAAGCDVTVQARHGFYAVSAVLAPLLGLALRAIPTERLDMQMALPAVMAFNLLVTTFFFVGALVLLEKAQGSLFAMAVTPIHAHEYLGAKVVTLVLLGLAESLTVVVIAFGVAVVQPGSIAGGLLLAVLYVLLGYITIGRFRGFNEYMLPAVGVTIVLFLPLLHVFGIVQTPLSFLHPVYPSLALMQGPDALAASKLWLYGVGGSLVWISIAFVWARRVYVGATTVRGLPCARGGR